jgi:hypothetical protein
MLLMNLKSLTASLLLASSLTASAVTFQPPASADVLSNPHRGFMLWGSTVLADGGLPDNFHQASVYHLYVPWRMIETADQVFAWDVLESTYLLPITQAHPEATVVIRLIADYPDGPGSGLDSHYTGGDVHRDYPLFLEQPPLNIGRNAYSSCDGDGPGVAPDWNDAAFINQANELITAFAASYDGDPRITAVQVGLLGLWGEWHQSGCASLAPGTTVKNSLKNTYNSEFTLTPLQTRYARDPDATGVTFGFHEDYFPSFTANCIYGFPACDDSGDWNLEYGLAHVVPAARDNWQVNPISGESPLTSQKNAWVNDETDITTVLNDYHFSFLGPAGKHEDSGNAAVMDRLNNQLGYRLQLDQLVIDSPLTTTTASVSATLTNTGSAPVYHPYQLALDWVNSGGQTVASWTFEPPLSGWLPGVATPVQQAFANSLANGTYSLRVWGKPMNPSGQLISLANSNRDATGRLILGDVVVNVSDLIFKDGFQ